MNIQGAAIIGQHGICTHLLRKIFDQIINQCDSASIDVSGQLLESQMG